MISGINVLFEGSSFYHHHKSLIEKKRKKHAKKNVEIINIWKMVQCCLTCAAQQPRAIHVQLHFIIIEKYLSHVHP